MKEIPLTQDKVALVDDDDFERLRVHKWSAHKSRNTFYAERWGKKMHAEIITIPKGLQCDHIDGNGLNNQKLNLRIVTTRQNQQNQHVTKVSRFTGVFWHNRYKRWYARTKINGKLKYIGSSRSEEKAAALYRNAVEGLP